MSEETTVSEETVDTSTESAPEEVSTSDEVSEEPVSSESEQTEDSFSSTKVEDLPPELQAQYKQMQGDYTRKMQELSENRNKVELYDQMQQEQLLNQKFPETPAAEAQDGTLQHLMHEFGVDSRSMDTDQMRQMEVLAKVIDGVADKRVRETIAPMQQDLMRRDYAQELASARKKFSDFEQFTPQIKSLVANNKQMSYEQAYLIASHGAQKQAGRNEALKNKEVKRAQASPSTSSATTEEETPKGFDNIFYMMKKKLGNT